MEAVPRKIQLVRSNGDFCETEVKNFIRGLPDNQNITVVSIIGPQGSGMSVLVPFFITIYNFIGPKLLYILTL